MIMSGVVQGGVLWYMWYHLYIFVWYNVGWYDGTVWCGENLGVVWYNQVVFYHTFRGDNDIIRYDTGEV